MTIKTHQDAITVLSNFSHLLAISPETRATKLTNIRQVNLTLNLHLEEVETIGQAFDLLKRRLVATETVKNSILSLFYYYIIEHTVSSELLPHMRTIRKSHGIGPWKDNQHDKRHYLQRLQQPKEYALDFIFNKPKPNFDGDQMHALV